MSNAIESGIRTRINEEYVKLQTIADQVVHGDKDNKFARQIHIERYKTQEGVIQGMELALEIIKERS